MRSRGIWNDLELQWKNENNVSTTCVVTVFETIKNFRKIIENNVFKACIIAILETIWNWSKYMKTRIQGRVRVQYDMLWYDILTCRERFESNETKWCILTLLCSTTFRGSDSSTDSSPPFIFCCKFWRFIFIIILDEV